jgi:hypothetical protein
MFGLLASLFRGRKTSARPGTSPIIRRTRLTLESLEDRYLPSISPVHAVMAPVASGGTATNLTYTSQVSTGIVQTNLVAPVSPVVNVPNLAGTDFGLAGSDSAYSVYDLVITGETWSADGSATFTATWQGDGHLNTFAGTGSLRYDAQGNISISFSWQNGAGQNSLQGTITRVSNGGPISQAYVYGYHYHLEGTVTPADSPAFSVWGDASLPPPMFI